VAEGKPQGLITKSYQVLFVIYAPIALVSLFLEVFVSNSLPFLFIAALFASVVSVVIAGVMWFQFYKHRSVVREQLEMGLPYVIRHQFMLLYLPVAFLSIGFSAYYIYDIYVRLALEKERIVVMLPITNILGEQADDVQEFKLALGSYLIERPELSSGYQFQVKDHNNHYSEKILDYVKEQSKRGTKYFVCGYSDFCSKLVSAVGELSEQELSKRPIFVTTLASSMNIPLKKNFSYRFFPRNRETAQALAGYATRNGAQTASFIATDDEYGRNASKEYVDAWQSLGGDVVEGIYIDPLASSDMASDVIARHFSENTLPDTVFVSTVGWVNPALKLLSEQTVLLLGVNYSFRGLEDLIGMGARADNIVIAQPVYKAQYVDFENTIALFLYSAIDKLIEADTTMKRSDDKDFDTHWWATNEPAFLSFEREAQDYRILMTARAYSDSLFSSPVK
jgi:hypothetical protein